MNQEILRAIQSSPEAMQALGQAIQEILQDPDITPENIGEIIRMFEFVLQNPDSYPEFRQSAIQSGAMDEEDLPMEFDEAMMSIALMALKVVQQQMQEGSVPRFARGGLNQIARMGRYGDTELAHINPFEARILQAYGGSGTVNPYTGQREFFLKKIGRALKKVVKAVAPVLPIALAFIPGGAALAGTLGSALSGGALAGTAANMLGSAAISGLSSAASGGDFVKGAIGGALGAGVAPVIGGAVGDTLGMTLGDTAKNVVGSAITGGAQSALSGGDFASGAMQGALGGYAGSTLSGMAGNVGGRIGTGLQAAGQQFGNAMTMGASPTEALGQSAVAGLTAGLLAPPPAPAKSPYDLTPSDSGGLGLKPPSDLVVEGLKAPKLNTTSVPEMGLGMDYTLGSKTPTFKGPETLAVDYSLTAPSAQTTSAQPELGTGIQPSPLNAIAAQTAATTPGVKGTVGDAPATKGLSIGSAASMLPLLSLFNTASTPEQVQQIVSQMTPEQQEYFNRPMRTWNWDTLSAAAKIQGLPIGSYIARNWDKVGGGQYDNPLEPEKKLARGGALTRLARGGGSGRDDTIPARLSDGEYVMDAETVALLGDGSTTDGARRLDQMRAKIRQHKGKSMARGKFSANAKSPLAYLKESA
jgi:filamentous hemagglutinin